VLAVAGESESLVAAPAATVSVALAAVKPVAEAVMVAVPVVRGVKVVEALPPLAVTGEVGLNAPDTPVTAKLTTFAALDTVLPNAS
jgi:hypothetical protein